MDDGDAGEAMAAGFEQVHDVAAGDEEAVGVAEGDEPVCEEVGVFCGGLGGHSVVSIALNFFVLHPS